MKQVCYIGNTTESFLQHSSVSARVSFLLFLSLCSCRSLACSLLWFSLSICAGVEGRSYLCFLCCTGGGNVGAGRRCAIGGQKITRGTRLTNVSSHRKVQWHCEPTFLHESLYGLRKTKAFTVFFEPIQEKSTLDSFLAFYVVIFLTFIYLPPEKKLLSLSHTSFKIGWEAAL